MFICPPASRTGLIRSKFSSGISLVEILVGIGIISIAMAAIISLQISQQRETRALSEKLSTLDVERLLVTSLADGSTCSYILNTPTALSFDSTTLSPTSPQYLTPTLPLYSRVVSGVPGPVLAQVGSPLTPSTPSLVVSNIRLKIESGVGSTYLGRWEIAFNPNSLVRPIKPISISTLLNVDTTIPTAATITSCIGSSVRFTNTTYHAFCATPAGGTNLKSTQPNRICTLSATDDDVGNTVLATDYKCRVQTNGAFWAGIAPLACGQVNCIAVCFDIE